MNNVLIVEEDAVLREALAEAVQLANQTPQAVGDAKAALAALMHSHPALVLCDTQAVYLNRQPLWIEIQRRHPGVPLMLMATVGSIEEAVHAMRHGAVDYLQKPISATALMEKMQRYIKPVLSADNNPIAQDPKSQALLSMALRVAQADIGVMITGESGTGKEVLAHFIHDHSQRKKARFLAINCAAIPEQMLEATLFGYEKGAFTGAYKSTEGKFEQAQGGTLLLDEVSEMSLPLQAKLLRVLQEKEVERIGSNKLIPLDVRVIATSNRTLMEEVKLGRFREDLYYRLNIFPLHWLPLRERIYDILPLANYLLRRHCDPNSPIVPLFSEEATRVLLHYSWPGNARELDNVIQRALVLQTHGIIEPVHLQLAERTSLIPDFAAIEQALKQHNGNAEAVALVFGVSEKILHHTLAKMREEGYVV